MTLDGTARATQAALARAGGGPVGVNVQLAPRTPVIYYFNNYVLIVATGDIYEDMPQAQQAAREGADIIAVIRSTGQSLLDYVPEGADP